MPIRRMDETLTLRVDHETKLALDLLSRMKRSSMSQVVLREVRKLADKELPKVKVGAAAHSLVSMVADVYVQDQLVKLAVYAPDLLTEEEEKIWRVISEDPA